jgi:aminoglycoside phosphotransferase (APT) family kinase protein
MSLAREALHDGYPHVIPEIYGWGVRGDETPFGWIMMEWKEGVNIANERPLEGMSMEERQKVLDQVGDVYARLKAFKLPAGLSKFGGITFDENGGVVGGESAMCEGGPFESYHDLWKAALKGDLANADSSPIVKGWNASGLRQRLEKFIDSGLEEAIGVIEAEPVLIHGDFGKFILL